MIMTGEGVGALASVAFRKHMAGATAQRATPTVPPLSPTHRKTPGDGFGGRLSADNLCVSACISYKYSTNVLCLANAADPDNICVVCAFELSCE